MKNLRTKAVLALEIEQLFFEGVDVGQDLGRRHRASSKSPSYPSSEPTNAADGASFLATPMRPTQPSFSLTPKSGRHLSMVRRIIGRGWRRGQHSRVAPSRGRLGKLTAQTYLPEAHDAELGEF